MLVPYFRSGALRSELSRQIPILIADLLLMWLKMQKFKWPMTQALMDSACISLCMQLAGKQPEHVTFPACHTLTVVPRMASTNEMSTSEWIVVPSRLRPAGCGLTEMKTYRSPGSPPRLPTLPSPRTRSRLPASTPEAKLRVITFDTGANCQNVWSHNHSLATPSWPGGQLMKEPPLRHLALAAFQQWQGCLHGRDHVPCGPATGYDFCKEITGASRQRLEPSLIQRPSYEGSTLRTKARTPQSCQSAQRT